MGNFSFDRKFKNLIRERYHYLNKIIRKNPQQKGEILKHFYTVYTIENY